MIGGAALAEATLPSAGGAAEAGATVAAAAFDIRVRSSGYRVPALVPELQFDVDGATER